MEWSALEQNGINFPFFCLGILRRNGAELPLHHLDNEPSIMNYNFLIPLLPLLKTHNNKILLFKKKLLLVKLQVRKKSGLIKRKGSWDNLWSTKSIFRSFEWVSRLKVNFYKSSLFGINLKEEFMEAAALFLSVFIPFKFPGIPVES